jgi:hypothetical protein
MTKLPTTGRVSGVQDFSIVGRVNSSRAAVEMRSMQSGNRRIVFIDSEVGARHLTGEILIEESASTLYVQTISGKQTGRTLFSGLNSNKEASIAVWHHDSLLPETMRLDVGKFAMSQSFAKSAIEGAESTLRLMDETAREQKALAKQWDPLFNKSKEYEYFLEATEPRLGKPPCMRWWCIAIFCVPAAGLIGFAIGHCRRGD